ncbi:FCPA [Symbiodinium sp. CCMP2592]|nr:FCPA [Symbiodinium sp. CCMP2592]
MQLLVASMFGMTISGRDRSPFKNTAALLSSAASASQSSPHIRVAMTKSTPLVAGALGTALYFASPSFVPPAAPHAATAAPENIQRSAPAGGAFGLGATAVTAAAAMGSVAAARQRVARKAEAVLEEAEPPFDPKKEPGVTLPLFYFDPLGFAKEGDREGFYQLRSAELKHGRVAMIASLGMVFQHWFRLPGFEDVPSGIQAAITPPGTFGLLAIVALGGALEFTIFKQDPEMDPGDFGDPAGFGQTYTEWKDRELNNCRMGMVSFLGIVVAELATGKDGVEQIWTPLGNLKPE